MPTINMLEAKSRLSELVRAIEAGEHAEIIIARNGEPVARLSPIARSATSQRIGIARGDFTVPNSIDDDNAEISKMFGAAKSPKTR